MAIRVNIKSSTFATSGVTIRYCAYCNPTITNSWSLALVGMWFAAAAHSSGITFTRGCALGRRLRELQEVLPLTLSPPAGSSAPVSLAASLRLAPPHPAQQTVTAALAGGIAPARQWPLPAAGPRVMAVAGGAAAPAQRRPVIRINGLLVPDGLAPAVDDGQEAQVCCLPQSRPCLVHALASRNTSSDDPLRSCTPSADLV